MPIQERPDREQKEQAVKRHGRAVEHAINEAKQANTRSGRNKIISRIRQHIKAQQRVAGDLLNKE